MTGEINLHSVLFECLQIMREELNICSKKYNGLEPKEGMEEAWAQARIKVQILQNMLHALDNEEVRAALGKWELKVKLDKKKITAEELLSPWNRRPLFSERQRYKDMMKKENEK